MSDLIILTPEEMQRASQEGAARRKDSHSRDLCERLNMKVRSERDAIAVDVFARAAEIALERVTGFRLGSVSGDFHKPDLGHNLQVRHTTLPHGCLILRPRDNSAHYYVLVTGTPPQLAIRGFATGYAIRQSGKYIGGDRPCWMMPQHLLKPLEECPALWLNSKPSLP